MPTALNRPACLLAVLLALAPHVQAEKADRALPMVVEADKPGSMDMQKQVVIFNGNVVLTQGTTTLRAERVEVRETRDGQRSGHLQQPGRLHQRHDRGAAQRGRR